VAKKVKKLNKTHRGRAKRFRLLDGKSHAHAFGKRGTLLGTKKDRANIACADA